MKGSMERWGENKRRNKEGDEKVILRERKEWDNGGMCEREGEIL